MSIFALGTVLLSVTAGLCMYALIGGLAGYYRKSLRIQETTVRAGMATFPLVLSASIILIWGFLNDQYQIKYIAYNSERHMPFFYKFSAFWGSLEGSVLLWLVMLSGFSATALWWHRKRDVELIGVVASVLGAIMLFFTGLLLITTNPFAELGFMPANGLGLNPLLQNIGMVVHPPAMYLGFTGLTVPFAFALAALITGKLDAQWIKTTRAWTLIGWMGLTAGNILGANWAYVELGWGGYWGWDPVENSALMPWFTVTAFLHSVKIQEKRGMLKVWNVSLIMASFWLTIFGTFLTRSGVVSSVHAFSDSNLGGIFLAFLGLIMLVSVGLLFLRWDKLKPEQSFQSAVSREAAFLYVNVLLVTICMIVLAGTTWPMIVEMATGKRASVGAPMFNEMNSIPGLMLLLLMAIGPLLHWRKMGNQALLKVLRVPLGIAVVVAIVETIWGSTHYFAVCAMAFSAMVLTVVVREYGRAILIRVRKRNENPVRAFFGVMRKNPGRYAGYIVHVGVVMGFVAIAGNFYATQKSLVMAVGDTVEFGGNSLKLKEIREINRRSYTSTMGIFDVSGWIGNDVQMWPEKRKYTGGRGEESTEVAIYSTVLSDFYIVMLDQVDANRVSIRLHRNPLVQWLWIGGALMIIGGLLAIIMTRSRRVAIAAQSTG